MHARLASDRNNSIPTEEAHEEAAESCNRFFRVLRVEYAKFFSMSFLYFCIVFAYSVLRDTKDAVVIGRMLPASIQYLKSFIVMGATMGFAIFFQYLLAQGITLQKIMFSLNIGFGVFFLVYSLAIIRLTDVLEPYKFWINDIFADGKMTIVGLEFLRGLLLTMNFWTGTLLYVAAELWGNVMTSVMFFAIANEICPLRQALRFYPLFIVAANIGLIASGGVMITNAEILTHNPEWQTNIISALVGLAAVLCFVNIITYRYLVKNIIPYPIYIVFDNAPRRAKKEKVGMLDGFKIMLKTPIVFHLSLTVLGYGICTNLTESAFKSAMQRSSQGTSKSTMLQVMQMQGKQQICIGSIVIFILFTPIKQLIQKKGWLALGMVTPVCTMIGAMLFLLFVWGNVCVDSITPDTQNVFVSIGKPLFNLLGWSSRPDIELQIGFLTVNMIKILKYAAFDICKEALGVKIPKQYKARFKGVYDGVFGKLGKSFSSNMQIALFFMFNTSDIRNAAFVLSSLVMAVALAWCYSSFYLGREYNAAVREDRDLKISEMSEKSALKLKQEKAAQQGV
ncbi:ATP:ADP antiporter, AAA family [Nematocida sp. AWRm77]|nr:ATP:ADP antiporter, AAA family [Nematocida sp. AWRm77]